MEVEIKLSAWIVIFRLHILFMERKKIQRLAATFFLFFLQTHFANFHFVTI